MDARSIISDSHNAVLASAICVTVMPATAIRASNVHCQSARAALAPAVVALRFHAAGAGAAFSNAFHARPVLAADANVLVPSYTPVPAVQISGATPAACATRTSMPLKNYGP